jgi:hypothetical protein
MKENERTYRKVINTTGISIPQEINSANNCVIGLKEQ